MWKDLFNFIMPSILGYTLGIGISIVITKRVPYAVLVDVFEGLTMQSMVYLYLRNNRRR